MQTRKIATILMVVAALALLLATSSTVAAPPVDESELSTLAPVGTAFTYQGRLTHNGSPTNSSCDFRFTLYDTEAGGSPVGGAVNKDDVVLTDGLFTVELDFGGGIFTGSARWLGIEVRCPPDGDYTLLTPRQSLTATPYALYALNIAPHNHLGETWTGNNDPLVINGSFSKAPNNAPLVLSNSHTSSDGLRVMSAGRDGVYVGSADYGLHVGSVNKDGVYVASADGDAFSVGSASDDGVYVYSAGDDGVHVREAGDPSTTNSSTTHNGFEVAGAQGSGLYVGRADEAGVYVESANWGLYVNSAFNEGVHVESAGLDGVYVKSAGNDGVHVGSAGDDGVYVHSADGDGVYVESADGDGVHVGWAGDWAGFFGGDVYIGGAAVGFFPRPTWNSGWVSISQDETKTLTHNLGTHPDDYFVDLQCKDITDGTIHVRFFGGAQTSTSPLFLNHEGVYYFGLTSSTVKVHRMAEDDICYQVRVRIWRIW